MQDVIWAIIRDNRAKREKRNPSVSPIAQPDTYRSGYNPRESYVRFHFHPYLFPNPECAFATSTYFSAHGRRPRCSSAVSGRTTFAGDP